MTLESVDMRVTTRNSVEMRVITGYRLSIERRDKLVAEANTLDHPLLGNGWATEGFSFDALVDVEEWDLEVADLTPDRRQALEGILARLLPAQAATEAAHLLAGEEPLDSRAMPWWATWNEPLPDSLRAAGASGWFDFVVPSLNSRHGDASADPPLSRRIARLLCGDHWMVVGLGPSVGPPSEFRTWGLPNRSEFPGESTHITGTDGAARVARYIRAVLGHVAWSVGNVELELETLENKFFKDAATPGPVFAGPDPDRLHRHLSILGQAISLNREAARTLLRRSEVQAFLPSSIRDEVAERCGDMQRELQAQRGHLRESFDLQRAVMERERAQQDQVFQTTIAVLAALFLGPGLVAAIYGANVDGLPGENQATGLVVMFVCFAVAAVVTIVAIANGSRIASIASNVRRVADRKSRTGGVGE